MRAAILCRVSTNEQGKGLSLDAQRDTCASAVAQRGWEVSTLVQERASAGALSRRPMLRALLDDMDAGRHDVLVVSRLDRLSRSAMDFYDMLDRAKRKGWAICCLDPAVDMTTPFGEAMAGMAIVFAQLERRLISQRQRDSVAARRANGTYKPAGAAQSVMTPRVRRRLALLLQADPELNATQVMARLCIDGYPAREIGQVRTVQRTIRKMREAT